MSDAVFFPLTGLIAAGLVALAIVWPQGEGAPSPKPFGHPLAAIGPAVEPAAVQVNGPGAGRAAMMGVNPGGKP